MKSDISLVDFLCCGVRLFKGKLNLFALKFWLELGFVGFTIGLRFTIGFNFCEEMFWDSLILVAVNGPCPNTIGGGLLGSATFFAFLLIANILSKFSAT